MVISLMVYSVVPMVVCAISLADTPDGGVASAAVGTASTVPATATAVVARLTAAFWNADTEPRLSGLCGCECPCVLDLADFRVGGLSWARTHKTSGDDGALQGGGHVGEGRVGFGQVPRR
jgi:hypothetical protein